MASLALFALVACNKKQPDRPPERVSREGWARGQATENKFLKYIKNSITVGTSAVYLDGRLVEGDMATALPKRITAALVEVCAKPDASWGVIEGIIRLLAKAGRRSVGVGVSKKGAGSRKGAPYCEQFRLPIAKSTDKRLTMTIEQPAGGHEQVIHMGKQRVPWLTLEQFTAAFIKIARMFPRGVVLVVGHDVSFGAVLDVLRASEAEALERHRIEGGLIALWLPAR